VRSLLQEKVTHLPSYLIILAASMLAASCGSRPIHRTPSVLVADDCRRELRVDLPWFPHTGSPGPDSSLVKVKFIDMTSLRPVSGMTIRAMIRDRVVAEVASDRDGEASLQLKSGTYRLEFRYIGYQLSWTETVLYPRWSLYSAVPVWQQPVC
jgi:hypothetical protein